MSSGSRGPSSGRYNDRSDYPDYNKSRRKNFYSPSTSRRDYKSGSGPLGGKETVPPASANRSYKSNVGQGLTSSGNSVSGPNVRDSRLYISDQYSGPLKGSSYGSYYPSYGSYNTFSSNGTSKAGETGNYYNSRGDTWRSDRIKGNSGDSRLSSSNKQLYSSRSSLSSSGAPPTSSSNDYRKDRYDSYSQQDIPPTSGSSKWKSSSLSSSAYNANKIPVSGNRGTLSGSASRFSKDRVRGSSYSTGGSSALVNSAVGTKRNAGDTYYPSSRDSFSSGYNSSKLVDRYSSNNYHLDASNHSKSRNHSVEPEELLETRVKQEADHYSPNASNDEDETNRMTEDEDDSRILDNDHEGVDYSKVNTKEEIDTKGDADDQDEDEEDEEDEDEDEEQKAEVIVDTKSALESIDANPQQKPKSFTKVDVSNEVCYPDGCTYPLTELETELENLKTEYSKNFTHPNGLNYLKYSLAKPVNDFHQYYFFARNYKHFVNNKDTLINKLKTQNEAIHRKRIALWREYSRGLKIWEEESIQMDQQLRLLHPPDDEMRKEIDASDTRKQNPLYGAEAGPPDRFQGSNSGNRRNRRHGDLVTTEAEFQEILQSLGKENDEEPLIKAERVAAQIPDLILDPIEREQFKFMDANNLVNDKKQWANRVKTDFVDNFSKKEHELFCEGFCHYPKRFGAISRHMGGLRTAQDCVIHYYVTKKEVNYKQLLAQHKKKLSKKAGRRSKTSKSRNVSQTQTPLVTPNEEQTATLALEKKSEDSLLEKLAPENSVPESSLSEIAVPENSMPESSVNPSSDELAINGAHKRSAESNIDEPLKSSEIDLEPAKKKSKKAHEGETSTKVTPTIAVPMNNDELESTKPIEATQIEKEVVPNGLVVSDTAIPIKVNGASPVHEDSKERRKTISSYWSITEANLFPELLQEHGTKWTTIADKLTTKTATMVRNYFQRNAEKNGWNEIAQAADQRLEAKFAAVLSTKLEQKADTTEAHKEPSKDTSASEAAITTVTTSQSPAPQSAYIPYGTFHHGAAATISTPNPPRMGINSLLADLPATQPPRSIPQAKPVVSEPTSQSQPSPPTSHTYSTVPIIPKEAPIPTAIVPPQRSSIMSLLNSDSSPVKQEPLSVSTIAPARQNLNDLLNNLSEPAPSNGYKSNVSSLLSVDKPHGANDQTN
ncbi:uncharacterized protein CANTADRAFT_6669 [Suhomyces tanzawaensis NRRL Y-17324]|uniref:Uncharacterized protein n=1 Tax=Suhomyces tanzawaensis NRRL Y-17324 TaxID=984487 RepID=A0A1E4SFM3_9ASCO|nr:uncharacterized protein CANTADRAFT_6669 [Suhomyces tanzawaensis NRRL Y-17324]ODV78265.1 hypothetical protein CANTADRAFT_6669 [Suhomyces tanzawaensis NRRL Y-17324]